MSSATLTPPFDTFRDALASGEVTVDGASDDAATLKLPANAFDFQTVFAAAQDADLSVTAITFNPTTDQFTVTAKRNSSLPALPETSNDVETLAGALDSLAMYRESDATENPLFGVVGGETIQVHDLFRIARTHGYRPVDGAVQADLVDYIEIELEAVDA